MNESLRPQMIIIELHVGLDSSMFEGKNESKMRFWKMNNRIAFYKTVNLGNDLSTALEVQTAQPLFFLFIFVIYAFKGIDGIRGKF